MPDIQWMNLDPLKLMEELSQFTSLEGFKEMLDKAQVGHAYMNRPCLNPSDPDCPNSAPNKEQRQVGTFMTCRFYYCCYYSNYYYYYYFKVTVLSGMTRGGGDLMKCAALLSRAPTLLPSCRAVATVSQRSLCTGRRS